MKVLAIRGCNLASIEGEFEVDFTSSPLSDCGLFAISGPTGAGKSTLLDALCLALYHDTPRLLLATEKDIKIPDAGDQDLSPQDPRHLLRRGCGSGFAEVDFVGIDGAAWRARWEVRRARERPEGRLQSVSVRLESRDGHSVVAEQLKETVAAIEARVGLSFDQFRRAVLLAQNDFATLLKAKQNERADLLEALTSTEVFSALSRMAHERAAAARREIEHMQQRLEILPTLSSEARRELEAAIAQQLEAVHKLEERREILEGERSWHADVKQRQAEVARARDALQNRQAEDGRHAADDTRMQRWSTLLPLQAHWVQQQQLLSDIASLDEEISRQAGVIEQARAVTKDKQEALDRANEQLDAGKQTKSVMAPRIIVARKLDQAITQAEARQASIESDIEGRDKELTTARVELKRLHSAREQLVAKMDSWSVWQNRHREFAVAEEHWPDLGQQLETLRQSQISREDITRALTEAETAIERQTRHSELAQNTLDSRRSHQNQLQRALEAAEGRFRSLQAEALEQERQHWRRQQEALAEAQRRVDALQREERQLQSIEEDVRKLDAAKQTRSDQHTEAIAAEQRAQTEFDHAEQARLRAQLAADAHTERLRAALVEGEPCLVCGATVHPGAEHDNSGVQTLLAELDRQFEAARVALRTAHQASISLSTRLDETEHQRQARQEQVDAGRERLLDTQAGVVEVLNSLGLQAAAPVNADRARDLLNALETELARHDVELSAREQELVSARQQVEETRAGHEQARQITEQAIEDLRKLERDIQPLRQAAAGQRARLDTVTEAIDAAARALAALGFASKRELASDEELLATWAEGDSLRRTAIEARAPLEGIKANLAAAEQAQNKAEARKASLGAELSKLSEELGVLRDTRSVTLEAGDTEGFAESLEQRLADLEQACKLAQQSHQAAKDAQTRSEGEAKSLTDRRRDREEGLQQTRAALQMGLVALPESYGPQPKLEELDTLIPAIPEDLEVRLQLLRERKQALRDAGTVLEATQAALKHLHDKPRSEREQEAVEVDWKALQDDLRAASETLADHRIRLQQDDSHRAQAAEHRAEIEAREQAGERWHRLDALIGSASGDKFKRYAQQFTLEVLLEYANQHLDRLAPRYQLQRGNENLSLLVIDRDFGDELRSVHSLSGGESFLIALGLALALASLSSERVRVESLFIDEGFGSLDAETLNMVMEALDRLQSEGRRIGVISHVHDMAERIGTQIRVVPTGRGRSRIEVVA